MTLILDSDAVLQQGIGALSGLDPVMARIIAGGAVPTLRKREPGFEGLAAIIVSQQLSTASASAIWGRVAERFAPPTPQGLLAASEEELRACGLSGPKSGPCARSAKRSSPGPCRSIGSTP
jgi:DNA-3-methyladenine glycosylase II